MNPQSHYCFDTSAFIDLRNSYPNDVFSTLWDNIASLISSGHLISPYQVLRELEQKDDGLLGWAREHNIMFRDPDQRQQQLVTDIQEQFPDLVDINKMIDDADPFVIALAKCEQYRVVTMEKMGASSKKPKIPDVCRHFGVKCVALVPFFREQAWSF